MIAVGLLWQSFGWEGEGDALGTITNELFENVCFRPRLILVFLSSLPFGLRPLHVLQLA